MPYKNSRSLESKAAARKSYHKRKKENPFKHRCFYLKCKANVDKLPFNLTPEYLESLWTGKCAISGIELDMQNHRNYENHAEVDRVIPELGYIIGNVNWLSRKYNRKKSDISLEDLKLIELYLLNG